MQPRNRTPLIIYQQSPLHIFCCLYKKMIKYMIAESDVYHLALHKTNGLHLLYVNQGKYTSNSHEYIAEWPFLLAPISRLTKINNSLRLTSDFQITPCISDPLYRPRWVKTAPRPSPLCECCTPLPAVILVISPLLGTRTGIKPRSPLTENDSR